MPLDSVGLAAGSDVMRPVVPVPRVRAADLHYERFLTDHVAAGRPVVVEGAVTDWPALARWTPAHFKERFGDKPVAVGYGASMPFDRFIDAVLASSDAQPGPYMYRLFLHEHLPEVLPDVIPQNVYSFPRRFASPLMRPRWRRPDGYLKLLIGGVGSKFPVVHFDTENANAAVTEVYGHKEFVLFAPEDTPFLYPSPNAPNKSLIDDLGAPDLGRFPLFARATCFRTVLAPGDMVFVPCGWWHSARPLDPSVSVCVNMLDESNWAGFVDEVAANAASQSRAKAFGVRAYLNALGTLLSSMEWLQRHHPALARRLRFPGRLAPISAAWTAEPSARQIEVLVPTA